MVTVTTLPQRRPFSRADLEQIPDDGHRYELVDGSLVVTPAPSYRHQDVTLNLAITLKAACPRHLNVLVAPFDVALADDTVLQPDLLVARRTDFTDRDLPVAPLLAVEVLSPSTRLIDTSLKYARYEAAGCPSYWVVDPDALTVTIWGLGDGAYRRMADVAPDETFHASTPYPLSLTPANLLD